MSITLPTHNETSRAAVVLLNDLNRHGITLPKPVADAVKAAQRTNNRFAEFESEGSDDALAALLADEKAPDQEKLTRAALAAAIATRPGVKQRVGYAGTQAVQATIREHGPAIVQALRPAFDQAAADLDTAAKTLGEVDLEDLPAITARGGDAAEQWKRATAAEKVITDLRNVLWRLSVAGGYPGSGDSHERVLAIAELDLVAYKKITGTTGPWEIRRHGTLSLADAEEFTARQNRIGEQWQADPANRTNRVPEGTGQYAATVNQAALVAPGGAL